MAEPSAALAFRERLREADNKFADAVVGIMATLRDRCGGRGVRTRGVELPALVRHRWITDIPSFGCLGGPHPDLRHGRLVMTETRCVAARFVAGPGWHAGPADDPLAEREPAIALVTNVLVVSRAFAFNVSLLALVDLSAIADWHRAMGRSAGGDSVQRALLADLGALAGAAAGPSAAEVGAFNCDGDGGAWVGEVAVMPGPKVKRYDGVAPGTVVMITEFK